MAEKPESFVYEPFGRPVAIRGSAFGQTFYAPRLHDRAVEIVASSFAMPAARSVAGKVTAPRVTPPRPAKPSKTPSKTRPAAKAQTRTLTENELRATVAELERRMSTLQPVRPAPARSALSERLDAAFSAPVLGVRVEGTRASFGLHSPRSKLAPVSSRPSLSTKTAARRGVAPNDRRELDAAFHGGPARVAAGASSTKKVFGVISPEAAAKRYAAMTGATRVAPTAVVVVNNHHHWARQESQGTP